MAGEKLFINWEELEQLIQDLVKKIQEDEFIPEAVIGISRGGLPISVRISHLLDLSMGIIQANHYEGDGYETKKDKAVIEGELFNEEVKGDLLVVDDITDTGKTLNVALEDLKKKERFNKIKTGVIHRKTHSIIEPDFCAYPTPLNKWIVYPYEK